MILKTDGNGNFVLPATTVLSGLSEQLVSRHRDLGLRHPLGVYNTSIAVVTKRVDRVLSLLRVVVPEADSGDAGSPEKHVDELLESQEALLHGLMHKRWTPELGQLAKVGSRPRRRSLECHGRDGVILLS